MTLLYVLVLAHHLLVVLVPSDVAVVADGDVLEVAGQQCVTRYGRNSVCRCYTL